jgi:hypothetical protein
MNPYVVTSIRADQIDPAYALVVHVEPNLSLEEWRDRCLAAIGMDGRDAGSENIIVVTNPLGYIQGLCTVATRQHPTHGRILDVPLFVVASVSDEQGVSLSLVDYVRAMSRTQRCSRIRIRAHGNEDLSAALRADDSITVEQGH